MATTTARKFTTSSLTSKSKVATLSLIKKRSRGRPRKTEKQPISEVITTATATSTPALSPPEPEKPKDLSVWDQITVAYKRENIAPTLLGNVFGGVVPIISFAFAHHRLDHSKPLYFQVTTFVVIACLLYSATTVYLWGERAFKSGTFYKKYNNVSSSAEDEFFATPPKFGVKAASWTALMEIAMILPETGLMKLVPYMILMIMVFVNGTATGCILSLDRKLRK